MLLLLYYQEEFILLFNKKHACFIKVYFCNLYRRIGDFNAVAAHKPKRLRSSNNL